MADGIVKSGCPVAGFKAVILPERDVLSISSFPVYSTPSVDTTISLAGIPATAAA